MYFGMTYNRFAEKQMKNYYDNLNTFEDEYKALGHANKDWLKENDYQGEYCRLLTVIDANDIKKVAFFQFSHYEVCVNFIKNKEKIIWSNDDEKIWNGDAKMM